MKHALIFILPLFVTACAVTPPPPLGEAMIHNQNIQAIAPTAAQKANTFIPADITRQKLARDRYRKDEVEDLNVERTNN